MTLGPFNVDPDRGRRSFQLPAEVTAGTVCFGHGQPLLGPAADALRSAASAEQAPAPLT